jgi:WD40 repeat protein
MVDVIFKYNNTCQQPRREHKASPIMDFTDFFAQTQGAVHFSPGGNFILSAVKDRLVVRRSDKEGVFQTWQVDCTPSATTGLLNKGKLKTVASEGWISQASWSPDSEYILAAVASRGVVNVYSMRDEKWTARIEAGVEGLVKCEWAPDSRNILCFSEWGVSDNLVWK